MIVITKIYGFILAIVLVYLCGFWRGLPMVEGVDGIAKPSEEGLEGPGKGCQVVEPGVLKVRLFEVVFDVVEVRVEGDE